jgi:hypothetical protein
VRHLIPSLRVRPQIKAFSTKFVDFRFSDTAFHARSHRRPALQPLPVLELAWGSERHLSLDENSTNRQRCGIRM